MTPSHAAKAGKRYRYYITREAAADQPIWRVSAHDIERAVSQRVQTLLLDRSRITRLVLRIDQRWVDRAIAAAALLAAGPLLGEAAALGIERVDLTEETLRVTISERGLLRKLGIDAGEEHEDAIQLEGGIARVRCGHELRLVVAADGDVPKAPAQRDERLVTLLAESMAARALVLQARERTINDLAAEHGRCRKRLAKLVRLSFLAPDIVQLILRGEQPPTMTVGLLDADVPPCWHDQRTMLGLT